MADDHPPITAVAAALMRQNLPEWMEHRARRIAAALIAALDTDPVREWAATVPCLRLADLVPDPVGCYAGPEPGPLVHPECLLAALAPSEKETLREPMIRQIAPDGRALRENTVVVDFLGTTQPLEGDDPGWVACGWDTELKGMNAGGESFAFPPGIVLHGGDTFVAGTKGELTITRADGTTETYQGQRR